MFEEEEKNQLVKIKNILQKEENKFLGTLAKTDVLASAPFFKDNYF